MIAAFFKKKQRISLAVFHKTIVFVKILCYVQIRRYRRPYEIHERDMQLQGKRRGQIVHYERY